MSFKSPKSTDWSGFHRLHEIFKKTATTSTLNDEYLPNAFRVSSLPFCGLLRVAGELDKSPQKVDYAASHYFSIGTAIHSLYQKFAAISAPVELIGNWKCAHVLSETTKGHTIIRKTCSKQYDFCSLKQAKKQHVCPHAKQCKAKLQYEEITLNYRGLSGHVDLLYLIDGKYVLADIKTTSDFLFENPKIAIKNSYYPALKYFHQIETYAILLEKLFGIKIDLYAIVYMSRSTPSTKKNMHYIFARKLTDKARKQRKHLLAAQIDGHNKALAYLAKPNKKRMANLYKTRPCKTMNDYLNIMDSKFFGKEQCEYIKDKTCLSGDIKRVLHRQILKERKENA